MTSTSIANDLEKTADQIGGHYADILRNMAGEIRASAGGDGREGRALHHMTLVQAVANAGQDNEMLHRLANLRIRCARLGLNLDENADRPLTIAIVDKSFSAGSGATSEKLAVKSALLRENLLHPSGL
jgi:hypothetical protein